MDLNLFSLHLKEERSRNYSSKRKHKDIWKKKRKISYGCRYPPVQSKLLNTVDAQAERNSAILEEY